MRRSFPQILEKALDMLEVRPVLLGKGENSYWFIVAAYGLVQAKIASADPNTEIQPARDRILRLYNKIHASQENGQGRRELDKSINVRTI